MKSNLVIEFSKAAFGAGFSSFSFAETGVSALTPASTSGGNVVSAKQPSVTRQIQIATSIDELAQQMAAYADAPGAVMGVDVGGAAGFLRRTTFTAAQTYVVARVVARTEVQTIKPEVVALDGGAARQSPEAFVRRFGDLYLSELHLGGALTLIVTVESPSLGAKGRFDTGAKTKAGTFSSLAGFASSLQSLVHGQPADIFASRLGGPQPPDDLCRDVDTALKYALDFDGWAGHQPAIYEAVFSPYAKVTNAPAGLGRFIEGPAANLASLASLKPQYLVAKQSLEYALQAASALGSVDQRRAELATLIQQAAGDIGLIDRSWRQTDVAKIPAAASLRFQHTPGEYQAGAKQ